MKRCFGALALLVWAPAFGAEVYIHKLAPGILQERLGRVARKPADRRAAIEAMFREAGCEQVTPQRVPGSKEPNIICTLEGETAGEIVVGGHFDLIEAGMGAVDDWSGASMLPSLYQSLAGKSRKHRIVFVAFAAEERGLWGSKEFVARLTPEARAGVRAMVNLECLGLSPVKVWAGRADKGLLAAYLAVTGSLGIQAEGMDVGSVGDDDSHPFLNVKIPVITLHSVTQETLPILHTAKDQLAAIHPEEYYEAYRVAATYLAYLDSTLN